MGGEPLVVRSPVPRRPVGTAPRTSPRPSGVARPAERILQLQRQAGNQAVLRLLAPGARASDGVLPGTVQRDVAASHPENPPVTSLDPAGALNEVEWTKAYQRAVANPSTEAYQVLFRDIALTAGMDGLAAGFVPSTVPGTRGKTAQPGLNMNLSTSEGPGHTGWVDKNGAFGVPLTLDKGAPFELSVAIILSPQALHSEKALSLRTVRHEMVHARHQLKMLEAVKAWQSSPGRRRPGFEEWLKQQAGKKNSSISALDVALLGQGAKNNAANTEVLGHVEGFTTDFHRRPPTEAREGPAFFELLGVVETAKVRPWAQADPVVQVEALTRLREYHATLAAGHQRLWKEWLDKQIGNLGKDKNRGKDFYARLTAFVT